MQEIPGKLEDFEKETLPEMYNRTIREIRSIDEKKQIWIQPSAATSNLGLPTSLKGVEDPEVKLIFSYQNYAPYFGEIKNHIINRNAEKAGERLEIPAVMTEFSGGKKYSTL